MRQNSGDQKEDAVSLKRLFARISRPLLVVLLLIPILLLIDALCYRVTLPVTITIQNGAGLLTAGSTRVPLGKISAAQSLQLVAHNPLVHEYQIDGSDSTNNLDLDPDYLSQIAGSPYYRFQSWMRDLDGTSRWRDLRIQASGNLIQSATWPADGASFTLPDTPTLQISLQLQRPETPLSLNLVLNRSNILQITLDRNDRLITVSDLDTAQVLFSTFFPLDPAPFAAMVIDTLTRILLWAIALLLLVWLCERGIEWMWARVFSRRRISGRASGNAMDDNAGTTEQESAAGPRARPGGPGARLSHSRIFKYIFQGLHPIAFIALGGSLIYVLWIALKEFQAQPHIYDASAYFFAAKMVASGQFSVPAPPASKLFPGPFMVIFKGRWFAQYDPGTALTLAPGVWFHVPWLVEPLLGTLALLGIGLIAARLYNRRVATLAVLLGCLSPFYSYLAASYLSHTIALFYLVWGLWALLRFAQGGSGWNMLLCGIGFGMAALTRDLVALLYIVLLVPGIALITWKRGQYRQQRLRRLSGWLTLLLIGLLFFCLYLAYNQMLTGDSLITPRNLFSAGDVWGFGKGIGFYGQHTLAAGFVNLDELLTSLQIDLFGWPFYLTLAFVAIPFLSRQANRIDWFLLIVLVLTVGSYIGYFYHGIYLGPRYLYEDLPFLLILSARGILLLGAWGLEGGRTAARHLSAVKEPLLQKRPALSLSVLALVSALILCNVIYYLPRQATLYQNFTGLPSALPVQTGKIYHSPVHHAVVVTDNLMIYQVVLFPLNDPVLKGDVIYAWGETEEQYLQLHKAFPGRAFYLLVVNLDGSVSYVPYSP